MSSSIATWRRSSAIGSPQRPGRASRSRRSRRCIPRSITTGTTGPRPGRGRPTCSSRKCTKRCPRNPRQPPEAGPLRKLPQSRSASRGPGTALCSILAALIDACLVRPASAQVPTPWFGTWTLNVANSTYSSRPPYKRATRRIEPAGAGLTIVDDLVRPRGGILHLEWTGKLDGADYPVQGVEIVLTNAYRRIDDYNWDITQKIDSDRVSTIRLTLSADGRTITSVSSSKTEWAR